MPEELNSHAWYLIFYDLSLDAIRPFLPAMGLDRPEDLAFTQSLQPVVQRYQGIPADQRNDDQTVAAIFQSAKQYSQEYPDRLSDWGHFIYPNQTSRQQQIFRWRSIVMRGARRPAAGIPAAPQIVQNVRTILQRFTPIVATALKPASHWDQLYGLEREDEGISPFEWVEAAVRNYRFLYAWNVATKESGAGELDQVHAWALHEAELLRIPKEAVGRPETILILPASLRNL
jgi:hypothetical protein